MDWEATARQCIICYIQRLVCSEHLVVAVLFQNEAIARSMKSAHDIELAAKPFTVVHSRSCCCSKEQAAIPERYINGNCKLLLYSQITYPMAQ
ncbi:hypothetical protein D9M69_557070 [compost metagenome]